jgi:hypothetical protein
LYGKVLYFNISSACRFETESAQITLETTREERKREHLKVGAFKAWANI